MSSLSTVIKSQFTNCMFRFLINGDWNSITQSTAVFCVSVRQFIIRLSWTARLTTKCQSNSVDADPSNQWCFPGLIISSSCVASSLTEWRSAERVIRPPGRVIVTLAWLNENCCCSAAAAVFNFFVFCFFPLFSFLTQGEDKRSKVVPDHWLHSLVSCCCCCSLDFLSPLYFVFFFLSCTDCVSEKKRGEFGWTMINTHELVTWLLHVYSFVGEKGLRDGAKRMMEECYYSYFDIEAYMEMMITLGFDDDHGGEWLQSTSDRGGGGRWPERVPLVIFYQETLSFRSFFLIRFVAYLLSSISFLSFIFFFMRCGTEFIRRSSSWAVFVCRLEGLRKMRILPFPFILSWIWMPMSTLPFLIVLVF